ncbi:MAG: CBS domain-containing protein [Ilumatobacteraceae bacterium]|nr:CBS domain-containing protein [Ilumatobacteraceae bacterium]MDP4735977.1 CBS domain-containing protein [Ilumatobacteraceae bacterium]MDP4981295.1 CBS domain-containing protein [Ilumatobacteraceae bacterium]MDP5088456.1 CBS domain-containing protein [Ilumatobacteraceae bacterium]
MSGELLYAFRIMRLPLLDAGGQAIGKINDIIVVPGRGTEAPKVLGFVATSQRRRIFISATRINTLDNAGAQLKSWDINLTPFRTRTGEQLLGKDILDKKHGDEIVSDVALVHHTGKTSSWQISKVRLSKRGLLSGRAGHRLVDWQEVSELFAPSTAIAAEAARLRDMHPSDVATIIRALPTEQRRQLADAMDDERLADVLEELPEDEQLRLIENLDMERLTSVFDEMEYDDLADLLGQMGIDQRTKVLDAMDDQDAETMRQLLSYPTGTAGSLMTPDIIVLGPDATVAEALAHIRDPERLVSIAAQVFVAHAPHYPPTGTYLGVVHFQRLLRERPSLSLKQCLDNEPTIDPMLADRDVAKRLASYNMLAVGVCDSNGRLLGAVTVDDVLDNALPADWRRK